MPPAISEAAVRPLLLAFALPMAFAPAAFPQGKPDKEKQRELDKTARKKVGDFRKAYGKAKSPEEKAKAIDLLLQGGRPFPHDLVFKELAKLTGDGPVVGRKLATVLLPLDTPAVEKILDDLVAKNASEKALVDWIHTAREKRKAAKAAIAEFQDAYDRATTGEAKKEAFGKLRGADGAFLAHELVFDQLAEYSAQGVGDAKRVCDFLKDVDHPRSGEILAAAARKHMGDREMVGFFIGLMDSCLWDAFYAAMGEIMAQKTTGDQNMSGIMVGAFSRAAKYGAAAAVEGMIQVFGIMEKNVGLPGGGDSPESLKYKDGVEKALREASGMPDLSSAEDYAKEWQSNRAKYVAKGKKIYWCPETGKRWEQKGGEPKACPHHGDPRVGESETKILAFESTKP